MRKYLAFGLVLLALFGLVGCAAKPAASAPLAWESDMAGTEEAPAEAPKAYGEAGLTRNDSRYAADGGTVYTDANAKLIREANLTLESMEYDKATADLDALVARCGGYYSDSNLWGGTAQETAQNRSAEFTVRVPKEQYNTFLSAIGGVAHVVRRSESTLDVGAEYYDTELRLQTARVKHERLIALLERADKMEDIITLENSLSQLQYEIDSLSGSLRKYDGLIDYATIRVTLSEVRRLTETVAEPDTFGVRMAQAAKSGASRFGAGMAAFAEWVAYHFIGVTVFLVLAAVALVILRRKGLLGKSRRKDPPAV